MKTLLAVTLATTLSVHAADSALTPDGSRYSVEKAAESPSLVLVRVSGDVRDSMAVPATDDDAVEAQPHVAYDAISGALYVVWTRQSEGANELRLAIRAADGTWSAPRTVTSGSERILGSQVVVTHSVEEDATASLIHVAWWKVSDTLAEPWYALVAIEKDHEPATSLASLVELAALSVASEAASVPEDTGAAVHPPLAMIRNGQGVDVVFGAAGQTAVTRLSIEPQRSIAGTARIFVPVGRSGHKSPRAQIVSAGTEPVQAFISRNGRVVLYAPGERFTYVVLDNGEWTPVRSIRVDDKLTPDHVLKDLQRTVEELETLTVPQAEQ